MHHAILLMYDSASVNLGENQEYKIKIVVIQDNHFTRRQGTIPITTTGGKVCGWHNRSLDIIDIIGVYIVLKCFLLKFTITSGSGESGNDQNV